VAAGYVSYKDLFCLILSCFFGKSIDLVDPHDHPPLDWLAIPLFCKGDTFTPTSIGNDPSTYIPFMTKEKIHIFT
jgi:hypothetical protein